MKRPTKFRDGTSLTPVGRGRQSGYKGRMDSVPTNWEAIRDLYREPLPFDELMAKRLELQEQEQ